MKLRVYLKYARSFILNVLTVQKQYYLDKSPLMSFKARYKDKQALETELNASWESFNTSLATALAPLQVEYKAVLKRRKRALIQGFVGLFPLFLVSELSEVSALSSSPLWWPGVAVYAFVVMPICVYLASRNFRDPNKVVPRFHYIQQELVFTKVFSLFGLVGERIINPVVPDEVAVKPNTFFDKIRNYKVRLNYVEPRHRPALSLLEQSELVTELHNQTQVGDKHKRTRHIFKGYFVAFDVPVKLEAKTFISTEGDTVGFGQQTFFSNLTSNDVHVTELEWNDFENLLHVATTNEVEARYILTTNYMQDLYDWWVHKKQNIRISFIGSRMYVLFPYDGITIYGGAKSPDGDALRAYVMSIAEPLMHVLHLVEDVNIRS
jgi:hypothetical protein